LWTTPTDKWKERDIWYYHLIQALTDIDMVDRVSFDFMGESDKNPSVGRASSFVQMALYLRSKKKNGWNQYQIPGENTWYNPSSDGWENGEEEEDKMLE
jgi:hypothetical protein